MPGTTQHNQATQLVIKHFLEFDVLQWNPTNSNSKAFDLASLGQMTYLQDQFCGLIVITIRLPGCIRALTTEHSSDASYREASGVGYCSYGRL